MKKLICCFSILVFLGFLPHVNSQDFNQKIPVIEVQGTASIRVIPDIMKWSVSIKIDSDDLNKAKKENDNSITEILRLLNDKGIEDKDIQTGGLKVSKNYDYYNKKVKKFIVSNDVWFTLKDISKYDEIASELILIDNVYINNTTVEYSKSIEMREQARKDALLAAGKKAEQMADVLGMAIGKPVLISEEPISYYYPNPFNNVTYENNESTYGTSTTFREGEVQVEAKVKVVFELLNK